MSIIFYFTYDINTLYICVLAYVLNCGFFGNKQIDLALHSTTIWVEGQIAYNL